MPATTNTLVSYFRVLGCLDLKLKTSKFTRLSDDFSKEKTQSEWYNRY